MLTKEYNEEGTCLFCASDYHLEIILLPYIMERINNSNIIIFTENNLDKSLSTLLEKTNLKDTDKEKIKNINWKRDDITKTKELQAYIEKNEKVNIIINGNVKYIKFIHNNIKRWKNSNITTLDCFHIDDKEVKIKDIKNKYKSILNTQKL